MLKSFFISYKWTLVTVVALIFSFLLLGFGISKAIHMISGGAVIFFCLVLGCRYKILAVVISALLAACISLELSYMLLFAERVSPAVLTAAQTVTYEMAIKVTIPFLKFVMPLFVGLSVLFFKSSQEIKQLNLKKRILALCLLILIPITITSLAVYKSYAFAGNPLSAKRALVEDPISYLQYVIYTRYPLILGDAFYIGTDVYQLSQIKASLTKSVLMPGLSIPDKNEIKLLPPKIIVVIGEASLADHYTVYDYPFETTPHLKQLLQNKEITVVKNVISGAPITRDSLRLALTFATPVNDKPFYQYKNVISMAAQVGYETVWLASTIEKGSAASYLNMLANSSEIFLDSTSLEVSKLQKGRPEDLAILPIFEQLFKKNKKQFFILHLEGSHLAYEDRYDEVDKALVTDAANTDYDRTIHHTDRFLNKLIEQIKKQDEDTLLFYFADHGEIVNKSHGLIYASDKQYKIPFILFQNKRQGDQFYDLVEKYRSSNGKFNLINFSYVISEVLGYKITPKLVIQAKKDGEMVFHADARAYLFDDISSGKKPDR